MILQRFSPAIALSLFLTIAACSESPVTPPLPPATQFDSYRGTAGTLPAGFFVSGEDGEGAAVGSGYDPFTGVSDLQGEPRGSFDGFGAFTNGGKSYSFGIRERGDVDLRESRLFLRYVNSSERHIIAFDISFAVEVWLRGERANRIRLKFNTETGGFSALPDIVSVANPRGRAVGAAVGEVVDGTRAENRSVVSLRVLLSDLPDGEGGVLGSLAPGDTGYFRWQYSNADGDEGELRSALALNDISIKPVYGEPPPSGGAGSPLHFSHRAGFYREPFLLALSSGLEGATIYYTVDGSEPDPSRVMPDSVWEALPVEIRERTYIYSGPIDLGELAERPDEIAFIPTTAGRGGWDDWQEPGGPGYRGTVVRARAIGRDGDSGVLTRSYFIDPEGRARYSLPVLSIATSSSGLFGPEAGIYVPGASGENYDQRGEEWERAAHLEYFEEDGSLTLAQGGGLRIHGGWTRRLPRKSLRLYARSEYGKSSFRNRFFNSKDQAEFKRLIVRNGGNDHNLALLRDATLQTLVQHLSFETQHYQPVIVFINGEYWGIHGLRDRYDDHHLSLRHGIGREAVTILENDAEIVSGSEADAAAWREFNERAGSGVLRSRAEFEAEMDLDGYLDYAIAQIYAANTDWPHNNVMFWRSRVPARGTGAASALDGRWRWLMYDVDRSFGFTSTEETDMIDHLMRGTGPTWSRHLFRGLMGVREIRHEFLQRAATHLETTFHPDRVREHIDSLAALLEPEIDEHVLRWRIPSSRESWRANVARLHDFAKRRPTYLREHIATGFDEVTGSAVLTITGLSGGEGLTLNGVRIDVGEPGVYLEGGVWTGTLFTGIPVVIRAANLDLSGVELSGEFTRVAPEGEGDELSFVMNGAVTVELRARFGGMRSEGEG